MSINGPWDEDPMWVPDLQDSEFADNEVTHCECNLKTSSYCVVHPESSPFGWFYKLLPLDRKNNIWGYNVNKQFDRWENKDGTLK